MVGKPEHTTPEHTTPVSPRHPLVHAHGVDGACCAGHAVPAQETLRAAEDICRAKGLRMTPQRRAVLAALVDTKGPLGAYDLIEILRKGNARGPAPIAIYRALEFLRDNGFIHRLETLNAFIACPHLHASGERVVFLICDQCRHVEETSARPLDEALSSLATAHGFVPTRQVMELAGTCRHCRNTAPKA
jgi:Fur family transcriptional regulator, zinc uptake regulator